MCLSEASDQYLEGTVLLERTQRITGLRVINNDAIIAVRIGAAQTQRTLIADGWRDPRSDALDTNGSLQP